MPDLNEFTRALAAELGVDADAVDVDAVLALAADAAHAVVRPAAPVAAFLVGLAAGKSGGSAASVAQAMASAREHIAGSVR